MKAIPPLTSHVLIQKNLSFPRPDRGYTTVVRHHGCQLYKIQRHFIQRQTFRIYRTVIMLVILHWSLFSRFYSFCLCRCYDPIFKWATNNSESVSDILRPLTRYFNSIAIIAKWPSCSSSRSCCNSIQWQGCWFNDRGIWFDTGTGERFFSSLFPDRLRVPHVLLSCG